MNWEEMECNLKYGATGDVILVWMSLGHSKAKHFQRINSVQGLERQTAAEFTWGRGSDEGCLQPYKQDDVF